MHQQVSQQALRAAYPEVEIAERALAMAHGLADAVGTVANEVVRFVAACAVTSPSIRLPEPGVGGAPTSVRNPPQHPRI